MRMYGVQVRLEVSTEPRVQTVRSNHLSAVHSEQFKLASIFPERPVSSKSPVNVNVGIWQASAADAVRVLVGSRDKDGAAGTQRL